MWNLSKLLSAFWGITGVIALFTLYLIYANFPEYNDLSFPGTNWDFNMDRQKFFLVFAGIFLSINLITFLAIRTTNALKRVLKVFNQQKQLRFLVAIKIQVCGANIFLITSMMVTKSLLASQYLPDNWQWVLMLFGPVVMITGLLLLLIALFSPQSERTTLH